MLGDNSEKKNDRYKVWIPLIFSLAALVGLLGGYKMAGNDSLNGLIVKSESEEGFNSGRVEELVRFIESRYVNDLDSEELITDAFQNVLEHLDPHSIYLKPEDMQQLNDQMGGSFEGIGIESILYKDTLYVSHVIKNGPADLAGLRSGDQIISINDTLIAGKELSFLQIREQLKGDSQKELRLNISSRKNSELKTVNLAIGRVDVKSVLGFVYEDYAVVRIDRFSSDSYKEFMDCLHRLDEEQGFTSLILDLRGNPGGFLPEATKMLNQIFKEKGRLLVYTQGRKERVSEYKSTGKNFFPIDKVAILVDEGSASGSEIIAGAIQDWDRGLVVGRRTFGKGLVQEQYNLSNGGALRLTVAEYFTPSGRLIQKSYTNKDSYRDDISNRITSGELSGNTDVPILDSTLFKTKLKQRDVYAGGGISPDIYIPLDSLDLAIEIVQAHSSKSDFVFSKFLNNKIDIQDNVDEFMEKWEAPAQMVTDFRAYLEYTSEDYAWLDNYLEQILKAEVAKLYFGKNAALRASFLNDDFLMQSVSALSKKNIFAELQ